jgi:hypothetical protein
MTISTKERKHRIQGQVLEQVTNHNYLGTITEKFGKIDKEISQKIGKAGRLDNSRNSWGRKKYPRKQKHKYTRKSEHHLQYTAVNLTKNNNRKIRAIKI